MDWRPGDVIVHQEIWRGRVWAARPMTVVDDNGERLILWMPAGTRRKVPMTPPSRPDPASLDDRLIELLDRRDWVHVEHEWDVETLWIVRDGDWHSTAVSWLPNASVGIGTSAPRGGTRMPDTRRPRALHGLTRYCEASGARC